MDELSRITLVTGGARSGKSALAERLAERHRRPLIYIATAEAGDAEMADRIARHQQRRGADWQTVEAPLDLAGALQATDGQGARLVDCLTLWLSNAGAAADVAGLIATLRHQQDPVVLVTNELGLGMVPMNALARAFRDQHGWLNQAVADMADQVWMAVCGQPLRIKPGRDSDGIL